MKSLPAAFLLGLCEGHCWVEPSLGARPNSSGAKSRELGLGLETLAGRTEQLPRGRGLSCNNFVM